MWGVMWLCVVADRLWETVQDTAATRVLGIPLTLREGTESPKIRLSPQDSLVDWGKRKQDAPALTWQNLLSSTVFVCDYMW